MNKPTKAKGRLHPGCPLMTSHSKEVGSNTCGPHASFINIKIPKTCHPLDQGCQTQNHAWTASRLKKSPRAAVKAKEDLQAAL